MSYLKEQLKGTEIREERIEVGKERLTWEEGEISEEEVRNAIHKLKRRKAAGKDGIQNEAWIFGQEEIMDELKEILNDIWKRGEIPEEWKTGTVKPIYKKGKKEDVKNYRELTLMDTGYKIYAEILRKRIEDYIEKEQI